METKKFIDSKVSYLSNLAEVLTPLQSSLTLLKDSTLNNELKEKLNTELKKLKTQKSSLDNSLKSESEKLSEIKKNLNVGSIDLPTFGDIDVPKPEAIIAFCCSFSGSSEENFKEFYEKIKQFSNFSKLSQKGFRLVLSSLLRQEAFAFYNDIKDETLENILKKLDERFSNKLTIFQYDLMLKNYSRPINMKLTSTMNEIDNLISKTACLVPPSLRQSRREFLLQEYLLKMVDSSTRAKLRASQLENSREGVSLTYDELFTIALHHEFDKSSDSKAFLATPAFAEQLAETKFPISSDSRSFAETYAEPFCPPDADTQPSHSSAVPNMPFLSPHAIPQFETEDQYNCYLNQSYPIATPVQHDDFYDNNWGHPQIPGEQFSSQNPPISRETTPLPWEESPWPTASPSYKTYHHDEYPNEDYSYENSDDYKNHELEISRKIIAKLPQIIQTICLNDPSSSKQSYNK